MLKKILTKNNIFRFIILTNLFALFIFFTAFSYVKAVSNDISNSVFRLHVIANNDSEIVQNLKYKVRDSLLEYINSLCTNVSSKEEVITLAQNHIHDFENIAKKVITDNGYDYTVTVEIGQYDFPTKEYGDVSLPAGIYDALRVKIGSASGRNWWCVMFPPLCFVDVSSGVVPDSSKELLQENLNKEEYTLITDSSENPNMDFKFKLVELFQNIKLKLANN